MPLRLKFALAEAIHKPPSENDTAGFLRRAPHIAAELVATLRDEDVLVVLLHAATTWDDAFHLSRRLIETFGTFTGVLSADERELRNVHGITPSVLGIFRAVKEASIRLAQQDIKDSPVLGSRAALTNYLQIRLSREKREEVRILYLNSKNMLIEDWLHSRGTVNEAPFYPREIIKKALEIQASALIIVHNHPSGDATPSEADIHQTQNIKAIASGLNISLHDHLIVGNGHIASLRQLGYIQAP